LHFGYLLPGLAGSGAPSARSVRAAVLAGLTTFFTLTEDPLPPNVVAAAHAAHAAASAARGVGGSAGRLRFHHLPIADLCAPADAVDIVRAVGMARAAGEAVLVHCKGGKGRTALVLVGLLLLEGHCPTPSEVLGRLLSARTVLTTAEQTAALKRLYALLCQEHMAARPPAAGPAAVPSPLTRCIVLCGLPCAGRRCFAYELLRRLGPDRVTRVPG
jgi:hypothetical protein